MDNPGIRPEALMCELVGEIGARPAGSLAEAKALDWIQAKLAAKYNCFTERFPFAPQPAFFPYYTIVGIYLVMAALLLGDFAWLGLAAPGLVAILPDLRFWVARHLPATAESQNLFALPPNCAPDQLNLLFCAHVDTARVFPSGYAAPFFDPLRRQVFTIMQRAALILALLAGAALVGIQLGPGVIAAALIVSGIVGLVLTSLDLWDQLGARQQFSAGANDNASGVAVLVALADELDLEQIEHLKIGFLFTGAEEPGLWGARSAARKLAQSGSQPAVICVDMVGAGESMRIMQGTKSLRKVATSPEVNAWLERADHLAVFHTAIRRSSDFEAFLEQGMPAGWIESSGTQQSWRAYHTQRDQINGVDQDSMGRAYLMLFRLVDGLARGKYSLRSR